MRALLVGLMSLALCQAATAQGNVSAQVAWYGVYTITKSQELDEPTSPTGKRYVSTPVPPTSNTDRVPGKDGVHFGLSYTLSGQAAAEVTVKHIYRFPPGGMPDEVSGGQRSTFERVRQVEVGKPVLMGWSFVDAPAKQIVTGTWTFEVWQGDRKLVGQSFMVFSP
jgi:hypothetical protein